MLTKSKLFLITFAVLLALSACIANPATLSTATIPAPTGTSAATIKPTDTPTIEPTSTQPSSTATATPIPATQAPALSLITLQMMDAEHGWAGSNDGRLLYTTDGGSTWLDRTPRDYQYYGSGFYLGAAAAWLPVYLADSSRFGLLYTADGGQSWLEYPSGPPSDLHFADPMHGWAVSGDVGAGNVYFSLTQTSDGGKTWSVIPIKPQSDEPNLPPGTIHLCNICNDVLYYDPSRIVIVYGDLGSMEPTGAVSMQVSYDLGTNWQSLSLPLPQGEAGALVSPNTPIFMSDQDGLLPVHLLKMSADGSFSEQSMVFYATADGGASWSLLPGKLDSIPLFTTVHMDQNGDVFIPCGSTLCSSHDGAKTWQRVTSDLDFTITDTRSISALDFIDATAGWVLVMENESTSLYRTTDGGLHWVLLSPTLAPVSPPVVTVDTSIPTPTTIPTPTP